MNQHVYQCPQGCLWQLDSGVLDNACRAIRDTVRLQDSYAAAIIIEAKRRFPAAEGDAGSDVRLQGPIEQREALYKQITETERHRQRNQTLKNEPADVALMLAEELDAWTQLPEFEHFAALSRIYLAVCKAAGDKRAEPQLIVPAGENGSGTQIRLAALVELLDRCQYDKAGQAEQRLRTELYDEVGRERQPTSDLFQRLPYLRALVQNSVNQAKLREAAEERLGKTIQEQAQLRAAAEAKLEQQTTLQAAQFRTAMIAGVCVMVVFLAIFAMRDYVHRSLIRAVGVELIEAMGEFDPQKWQDRASSLRDKLGLPVASQEPIDTEKPTIAEAWPSNKPPLQKTRPKLPGDK